MFTWILITLAAVVVVAVVVHEIRSWRRPGRKITQNAPMDDANTNHARYISETNLRHGGGPRDLTGGI